ncbi:uncharacterized protein [Drosophila bipectinata]|uniref:uncharacterized protein n=1 Tax=Drosophila bipectinata TaxID=42026 RepID=UPI001C8A0342|nr:uncharacterized protein LOC108119255 [Drosophila bipectinata]
MLCHKCCYFVPLNIGCLIISGLFLSYHVGEVLTHTNDTIFLKDAAQYKWIPVLFAPLYTGSIISSMLLIYGAYKQRKGFVLVWVIMHVPIFVAYLIMTICDGALKNPPPLIIAIQVIIVVGLFYSLFVVLSYYQYLNISANEDEEYEI